MHYGKTQCLDCKLACNLGQICALFWFWGLRCDDITICATFSDLLAWAETYKTVHASARLQTTYIQYHGLVFPRRTNREIPTPAPLCTLHRPKSGMVIMLARVCHLIYWAVQKCYSSVVTHVLWAIWGVEFDADIAFDSDAKVFAKNRIGWP